MNLYKLLQYTSTNQFGIASLIIVFLLLAGILTGTYFIQQQTNLFPKAAVVQTTADTQQIKVLVISYYPLTSDKKNLDKNETGLDTPLTEIKNQVKGMNQTAINALTVGSIYQGYKNAGGTPALTYAITTEKEYLEAVPYSNIGAPPQPDYMKILERENICDYIDNQGVSQVWLWSYHTNKISPVESNMAMGKSSQQFWNEKGYGDVSNSGRHNDMPVCNKTYSLFNYNYQRGVGEMLEDHGHHIEAILRFLTEDPPGSNKYPIYEKFVGPTGSDSQKNSCGWMHMPPNGVKDYDWTNEKVVNSDCTNWNPNRDGTIEKISCHTWDGPTCSNNGGQNYKVWWFQNLPGLYNNISFDGKGFRNFWDFYANWDKALSEGKTLVISRQFISTCSSDYKQVLYNPIEGADPLTCAENKICVQKNNSASCEDKNGRNAKGPTTVAINPTAIAPAHTFISVPTTSSSATNTNSRSTTNTNTNTSTTGTTTSRNASSSTNTSSTRSQTTTQTTGVPGTGGLQATLDAPSCKTQTPCIYNIADQKCEMGLCEDPNDCAFNHRCTFAAGLQRDCISETVYTHSNGNYTISAKVGQSVQCPPTPDLGGPKGAKSGSGITTVASRASANLPPESNSNDPVNQNTQQIPEEIPFGKVGLGQSPGKEGDNPGPRSDFAQFIKDYNAKIARIKEDERIKQLLSQSEVDKRDQLATTAEQANKEAETANEAWKADKSNKNLAKKASDATKNAADALTAAEAIRKLAKLEQILSGQTSEQCVKADLGLRPWLNARRLKARGEDTREDGSAGDKYQRFLRLYVCSGKNGNDLKWRVATEGNDNTQDENSQNSMERILGLHGSDEQTSFPSPKYPFSGIEHGIITLEGQSADQISTALTPYIEAAKAGKPDVTDLMNKIKQKSNPNDTIEQSTGDKGVAEAYDSRGAETIHVSDYPEALITDCKTEDCPDPDRVRAFTVKYIYDQSQSSVPEYDNNKSRGCFSKDAPTLEQRRDSVEFSACGPTSLSMIAESLNQEVDPDHQTAVNMTRYFLDNNLMNCSEGLVEKNFVPFAINEYSYNKQQNLKVFILGLETGETSFAKLEQWYKETAYPTWTSIKLFQTSPHLVAVIGVSDNFVWVADPYDPGGQFIFRYPKTAFARDYFNKRFWKVTPTSFGR